MRPPDGRKHARAAWIGVPLFAVLLAIAPCPAPARAQGGSSAAEGKKLFETICVACHTIGAGVRIGPDLQGVTERRPEDWLRRFIRNPEELVREQDPVAKENLAKFGVLMPTLGLTEQQVAGVIAYLGGAPSAPAARPALHVPVLALAALAGVALTLIGLSVGAKKVEIRT